MKAKTNKATKTQVAKQVRLLQTKQLENVQGGTDHVPPIEGVHGKRSF